MIKKSLSGEMRNKRRFGYNPFNNNNKKLKDRKKERKKERKEERGEVGEKIDSDPQWSGRDERRQRLA